MMRFWLLLTLLASPALAQVPAALLPHPAAAPASQAAPAAPPLTPAETKQMLDLLNDPQKRAAFTASLETLQKAATATGAAKPATTAAAPVKLAPDSVGAALIAEGTAWLGNLSGQFQSFGSVLGHLPSVWTFTQRTFENPVLRERALDAAWRLATVLAVAALAEWGFSRLLRRPMRAIAARAPEAAPSTASDPNVEAVAREREEGTEPADGEAAPPTPEPGIEEREVEHALRRRRFARTIRTFKRLPFVLLCFVLDLMPLGVFLGISYAGAVFADTRTRAVLQAAVLAYALCRAATSLTRMVVAPDLPTLRLAHVSDAGATYAVRWVRRLFAVAAIGYAAAQIGLLFGLPAQAEDAFLKAVFLVAHAMLVIVVLQCRASVARRIRSPSAAPGVGGRLRNLLARVWHLVAIFYIVGLWLVWAAEIRHGYIRVWHLFLVTVAVLVVSRLTAIVLLGGLDRALRVGQEGQTGGAGAAVLERRARRYLKLMRSSLTALILLLTGLALLQVWGINTLAWFGARALGSRLLSATATILVAALIALAVWEGINASFDRNLERMTSHAQLVGAARLRTLLPILRTLLMAVLLAIFGLTALSEIGVNIAPLLAGAGILGVAIGFGSQKLVQDFITGIFLLIENAMQVGDWVTVAGLSGSVENLSIRTMRLRAGDGSVHIIPFSAVSTVTNVNRGIGNAAVSVNVPIEEDTDRVGEVLGAIAREMRAESRFSEVMRSDLQLWGVDRVDAGVATVVGQIVCTDSGRWAVQREFNRRMAIRFKEQGLRIATPVTTVYNHVAHDQPPATTHGTAAPVKESVANSPPPAALGNTS